VYKIHEKIEFWILDLVILNTRMPGCINPGILVFKNSENQNRLQAKPEVFIPKSPNPKWISLL